MAPKSADDHHHPALFLIINKIPQHRHPTVQHSPPWSGLSRFVAFDYAQTMPLEPIEIPASATAVKDWFNVRPNDALIREIKTFIRDTGTPYLWRGHTHTRPPRDAFPYYLGEFDLPRSHQSPERRAPCPCCTPTFPKYARAGKIAWFPDERVIRCLGPECFKSLNREGHDQALARLRREEQVRYDIAYVLSRIDLIPAVIACIDRVLDLAISLDSLHTQITARLEFFRLRLWDEFKDEGILKIRVSREEQYRRRDGSSGQRTVFDLQRYARIPGTGLLNPRYQGLAPRLRTARVHLAGALEAVPAGEDALRQLDDNLRTQLARRLARGLQQTTDTFTSIAAVREFLEPTTLATLRTWGAQPGCACPFYIRREGQALVFGPQFSTIARLTLPEAIDGGLPVLPAMPEVDI